MVCQRDCVNYLLVCNKLPHKLVAKIANIIISYFLRIKIWESISWVFLVQDGPWSCSEGISGYSDLQTWLDWRIHFKNGSNHIALVRRSQFLTGCWQEALVLYSIRPLNRLLNVLITWQLTASRISSEKERRGSGNMASPSGLRLDQQQAHWRPAGSISGQGHVSGVQIWSPPRLGLVKEAMDPCVSLTLLLLSPPSPFHTL